MLLFYDNHLPEDKTGETSLISLFKCAIVIIYRNCTFSIFMYKSEI